MPTIIFNRKWKLLLILFTIAIPFNTLSQPKIFSTTNSRFFLHKQGIGTYIDSSNTRRLIKDAAKWLYFAQTNNQGWLIGLNFDGIAYRGLQLIFTTGVCYKVDLIKLGLPTNYIECLSVWNQDIAIVVNNKIYISTFPYSSFKIFETKHHGIIKDIYINQNKLAFTTDSLIFLVSRKENSDIGQLTLSNPNNPTHLLGIEKNIIFLHSFDTIYSYDITNKKLINNGFLDSEQPPVKYNNVYYFISPHGIWFFDGQSKGKISMLKTHSFAFNNNNMYYLKKNKIEVINSNTIKPLQFSTVIQNRSLLGFTWEEQRELKDFNAYSFFALRKKNDEWEDFHHFGDTIYFNSEFKINQIKLFTLGQPPTIVKGYIFRPPLILKSDFLIPFVIILTLLFNIIIPLMNYKLLWLQIIPPIVFLVLAILNSTKIILINVNYLFIFWIGATILFFYVLQLQYKRKLKEASFLVELQKFSHGGSGLRNIQRIIRIERTSYKNNNKLKSLYDQAILNYKENTVSQLLKIIDNIPINTQNILRVLYIRYLINKSKHQIKQKNKNLLPPDKIFISQYLKRINNQFNKIKLELYLKYKTNPLPIINRILKTNLPELKDKNINIKINDLSSDNYFILCEVSDFYKIIEIFIENSIEAVKSNLGEKIIQITIKEELLKCSIEIYDNGCGIPKDIAEKIFSPTSSTKNGGGFGLYFIKKTVEKYLGEVSLSNINTNKGTLFTLKMRIIK